ncbi:MAG: excinuclease ABC subunit UvrC [Bacilli bacterium]|nr:excinuclease ABC subunit UvrC [Bacilli bacterium]
MNNKVKVAIPLIPHQSGVYQMFDKKNKIIYIGKAKDLYKRVSQYFLRPQTGKVAAMVMHGDHFTYILTKTEKEALILEMNLIHEHLPRYNILLKDDSHYPYIALAKNHNPLLKIARNRSDNKFYYFGPYPNSGAAYQVIDMLNKLFPLRKCRTLPKVPCLYKELGQCLAPCVRTVNPDVYQKMVNDIRSFLDGNNQAIKNEIKQKMLTASEEERYEQANEYKKLLQAIDKVSEKQVMENPMFKSLDVFAYSHRDGYLCLAVLTYRNATLLGKNAYIVPTFFNNEDEIIHLIEQYYQDREVPKMIAVNLTNTQELEAMFLTKVLSTKRGAIYEAILVAENNAKDSLDKHFMSARLTDNNLDLLVELGKLLKIDTPYHIELFDNSHLQGSDPVSALVVYINGRPNKKMYRKYHIEGQGNDDFASMREVVARRYKRLKEEKQPFPDLLLLDGGLPQLRAIKEKYPFPIFGLYKDDKHQTRGIIDQRGKIYPLNHESPLFLLLMRMQDEVHRFAISFHKEQRSKRMFKSIFDDIPGLGKKRLEVLMKQYQTIDDLTKASEQELCQILSASVAKILYERLHK